MVLALDWLTLFSIAGLGVGVVFVILVVLVCVLQIFTVVAKKTTRAVKHSATAVKTAVTPAITTEEEEKAALAVALFLFKEASHDHESGQLTIHEDVHSLWHEELNERL